MPTIIFTAMRIGFDAKRAFHNNTGLGNYSRTLILSLAEFFPDNEYFLFNPKPSSAYRLEAPCIREVRPSGTIHSSFPSLWRSFGIRKDLLSNGIDLYHGLSHEIPRGLASSGIKSVVTIHDLIFERYPHQFNPLDVRIYREKFRHACRKSDRIIAISEQTKNDIIQWYDIPQEKIEVCYQSCRPEFFNEVSAEQLEAVKRKYRLPENYFLYVGSIIERKNLHRIIAAMAQTKASSLCPLIVIGTGKTYRKKVAETLRETGLTDQVRFLSEETFVKSDKNFISGRDFPAIYKMASALIYPSLYEGFGIPVLEALASGTPVITSNTSCLPEAGGPGSLYVNPEQVGEIAEAIDKIATDNAFVKEMILKGRSHALHFTRQQACTSVMKVYKDLMGIP